MNASAEKPRECDWVPNRGPQTRFLASTAYEVLYGGQAGGGKTEALVIGALRWVRTPGFRGLILRRTFPELKRDIIPLSEEYYPSEGGTYNQTDKQWKFPSGAVVEFGHCEHEPDVRQYQGVEVQYLAFDELTSFTEFQYRYLLSRVRSSRGIPIRVRSATNPGGVGHDWVLKRWAPWLDRRPDYKGTRVHDGAVLAYANTRDGEAWVTQGYRTDDGRPPLTRQFIRAQLSDNPKVDPDYRQRLMGQDALTRAQLLDGDWLARAAAGVFFKRRWFEFIEAAPAGMTEVRYWDRAATKDGGDWTRGVRMGRTPQGVYVVSDIVSLQGTPLEVERAISNTASGDGRRVMVGIEQDPGQAGVAEADYYVRRLAGFNVRLFRPTGDKVTRAQPFSAQCEAGNVKLLKAAWNDEYIAELEAFPDGSHDDQVDASSGAFSALNQAASVQDYVRAVSMMAKEVR